jgi:hypothetical protein
MDQLSEILKQATSLVTFDVLPIAAIFISLALGYFPKLNVWWSGIQGPNKQKFLLGLYFVIPAGVWVLSLLGLFNIYPIPTEGAVWQDWIKSFALVGVDFFIAMAANIVTYRNTNKIGSHS